MSVTNHRSSRDKGSSRRRKDRGAPADRNGGDVQENRGRSSRRSKPSRSSRRRKDTEWYEPPPVFHHGRFSFGDKLGKGGFAFVFAGWDNLRNEPIAIKVENSQRKNASRSIKKEFRFATKLHAGECLVPKPIWCGRSQDRRVMVMQQLGDSLSNYFKLCGKRFSAQTTISLAIELISILESVHDIGILHRDIKLQNFLTAYRNSTRFYICDFGLSDHYLNTDNQTHIPLTKGHSRYGTVRYASMNNHKGYAQSRRDDLESLGFVLLYAARGNLPWQTIRDEDRREKWTKVFEMKRNTRIEDLCENLPAVFITFMEKVRELKFEERPNYDELRELFRDEYDKQNFTRSTKYDWETAVRSQMRDSRKVRTKKQATRL